MLFYCSVVRQEGPSQNNIARIVSLPCNKILYSPITRLYNTTSCQVSSRSVQKPQEASYYPKPESKEPEVKTECHYFFQPESA